MPETIADRCQAVGLVVLNYSLSNRPAINRSAVQVERNTNECHKVKETVVIMHS